MSSSPRREEKTMDVVTNCFMWNMLSVLLGKGECLAAFFPLAVYRRICYTVGDQKKDPIILSRAK